MNKIGFIGYGKIGSIVINNILSLNLVKEENVMVSNRNLNKLNHLKDNFPNITTTSNNEFLAKLSDIIFIFVDTADFKIVLNEIKPFLKENIHIIHSSAGLSFENIANIFKGKVSQFIPTTVSKTGINLETIEDLEDVLNLNTKKRGVSLIAHNKYVSEEEKIYINNLIGNFSYIKEIDGNQMENPKNMEIATILSSCGPAFLALLINKIVTISSEIILKNNNNTNISQDDLEDILIKTLLSTAIQLNNGNLSINGIINQTATKGGITQEGLDYLDLSNDFINGLFDNLLKKYDNVKNSLYNEYSS